MKNACATRFALPAYVYQVVKLAFITLFLMSNSDVMGQCFLPKKDTVNCMDSLLMDPLPVEFWPTAARAENSECRDSVVGFDPNGFFPILQEDRCTEEFSHIVLRSWRANYKGGDFEIFTDTLCVASLSLDSLICPEGVAELECGDEMAVEMRVPRIKVLEDTIKIYPTNKFCKLDVFPTDKELLLCGKGKWLFREWLIKDIGCGRDTLCIDSVLVTDSRPPEITFDPMLPVVDHGMLGTWPTDTIGTDGKECLGHGVLPSPTISDDCSDSEMIKVTVYSPTAGFTAIPYYADESPNLGVWGVEVGEPHLVIYNAIDDCHLVRSDTIVIVAKDNSPPVAVCHNAVNLTLSNAQGFTLMKAASLNAESYDNCGINHIWARRTDWETACGMGSAEPGAIKDIYERFEEWVKNDPGSCASAFEPGFADVVPFCCDDIGKPVMVELLVVDFCCNIDKCWGFVNVENKIAPIVIEELPSDTITCMAYQQNFKTDVESANLAKLNQHFGNYVSDPTAQTQWVLQDIDCDGKKDPRTYWDGLLAAACDANVGQRIEGPKLGCGKGVIKRIWEAALDGHNGGSLVVVATQKIYIKQCPMTDMIVWPDSIVEVEACGVTYGLHGNVEISTPEPDISALVNDCRNLGLGYFDKVFDVVSGKGCTKVLRTWCVLDWCDPAFDNVTDWRHFANIPGVETFVQKIVLVDNTPPSLSVPTINENNRTVNCTASLSARVTVQDACGATTRWSVTSLAGSVVSKGIGLTANVDALPPGDYILLFTATDACGNETSERTSFNVATEAVPSVVAYTMLTTQLTPMDLDGDNAPDAGMATIWGKEYNSSSAPPCGASADNLIFCLRVDDGAMNPVPPGPDENSLTFDCTDKVGDGVVMLQFWVKDTVTNTADFTYVFVQLVDNSGICGTTAAPGSLAGLISTEINEQVANVRITGESASGAHTVFSKIDGTFQLNYVGGPMVKVVPEKDTDHRNGISTLDLVRLQKHILGRKLLASPYKLIAADANRDGKINPIDLIQLRRLIIQKDERLLENTSWRFVDASYQFARPEHAQSEDFRSYTMAKTDKDDAEIRFVGIKVGDLDGNVVTSRSRAVETLPLQIPDRMVEAGEVITIPMHLEVADIEGLQFGLLFAGGLQPVAMESDQLFVTAENYELEKDKLRFSWIGESSIFGEVTLNLRVRATQAVRLSDAIGLDLVEFGSEVISELNPVKELHVDFVDDRAFSVEQNQPNPFADYTQIYFTQPGDGKVTLEVSDVSGKVIYRESGQYPGGQNFFELRRDQVASGILHYKIITDYGAKSKRMINMN